MELKLPAPCLIVLVGPSGSGKSTWAGEFFANNQVVSSDALRAVVGAGEDDQTAGPATFEILNRIVDERMGRGLTTVIDTLGYDRESRRRWIAEAHERELPAHAIVFDISPALCEERNESRARPIPKTVLRKQLSRLKSVIDELPDDGFDGIHTQRPVAVVTPVVASDSLFPKGRSDRFSPQERSDVGGRNRGAGEGGGQPPTAHTFGLIVSRFNWENADLGDQLASVTRRAEAAGFRDLWVMDHFRQIPQVGRVWEDIPEAYTALSYVAGSTQSIRLGSLVTGITHRHPVVLGKMLASLDVLSGGRAICGLGLGWDEKEHTAYGIDFPPVTDRYTLLEETLQMLPLLWGKGTQSFRGRLIDAPELTCYPRPIQDPIPILVGGSGEKRTLRLVARYADACNLFGDPERIRHKVGVLMRHCVEVERDPSSIEVTHLITALAATNRKTLRERVDRLRDRNTPAEKYMERANAGTVDDLVTLFGLYSESGAQHSIVAIPDVAAEGSIETFGEVIAKFALP